MRITLFTSNKNRHNYLINLLSEVCEELFVVQECDTILSVPSHYQASPIMKKYFENVINAQYQLFGNSYVNNNVHSKYIIVDNALIVTTFNYTPTQFTYIEDVKIPAFDSNPSLSYEGVHSEVGHMAVTEDPKTIDLYEHNFLSNIDEKSLTRFSVR